MIATHLHFLLIASLVAIVPSVGLAQTLPADCSAATAPTQPLAISVGGVKFTPKVSKLRSAGGVKTGDEEFDSGNIYLCVAKGQTTMFNKTPTKEESYAVGTFQARIE